MAWDAAAGVKNVNRGYSRKIRHTRVVGVNFFCSVMISCYPFLFFFPFVIFFASLLISILLCLFYRLDIQEITKLGGSGEWAWGDKGEREGNAQKKGG